MSALNGMPASTTQQWLQEIRDSATACEARRSNTRKPQKTGTISEAAALYLRCIVERVRPQVAAEIGTFIGTSALVLAARGARVYTCDKDNAALQSDTQITCYQKTGSTDMLRELAVRGVRVDLFFFDGRIQQEDLPLIAALARPGTVYAFDDYEGNEKGVVNVRLVRGLVPHYRLRPPPADVYGLNSRTTIAVLAPKGSLL